MKSVFSLVLLSALALPILALPTLAETREERLAVAEEYVEFTLQGFDVNAMIDTMYQPVLQAAAQHGKDVSADELAQITKLYRDTFTDPLIDIMRAQASIMADMMTLAEIKALRDFYATPEGSSVMTKLPQLVAAQQPMIMTLIEDANTNVLPKIITIIGD